MLCSRFMHTEGLNCFPENMLQQLRLEQLEHVLWEVLRLEHRSQRPVAILCFEIA
jgi:hypothetical protein